MIKIISVGSIKEKYIEQAIQLKMNSINKNHKIEIISVEDEKCPENLSDKEKAEVKRKEGERILRYIKPEDYVVALTLTGKKFQDNSFSKLLFKPSVCFLIGGSLGLSEEVCRQSNKEICFGKMTFPHQLMRWALLEEIAEQLS